VFRRFEEIIAADEIHAAQSHEPDPKNAQSKMVHQSKKRKRDATDEYVEGPKPISKFRRIHLIYQEMSGTANFLQGFEARCHKAGFTSDMPPYYLRSDKHRAWYNRDIEYWPTS
jgi:hypothetical protein